MFKIVYLGQFLAVDWELFEYKGVSFVYRIIFDWVSLIFLAVVFIISRRVIFYRHEYIRHEKTKVSFAWVVLLFVLSMIFLIIRPRLLRIILGWDGLGLVSYLLVIYYQNYKSYSAGIITCLTNRIGDRAILVAIGWILSLGRLDFYFFVNNKRLELIVGGGFIVLAAITKRAQIPFSAWLPAAIAAPTPVSALVHSSTLVTAGVFLLIRFYPCLIWREIKNILFIAGALTITMASLGALYEMDLKKIIALSTLSQLGLIIIALSINLYILALFHLLTHALFKASLFLAAGRVIHLYRGRQDIRSLRIVTSCIPVTRSLLIVCSLSLGGTPFLSAFYSKDKIIEVALEGSTNFICLFLLFFSILLTMMYSFRLIYYIRMERFSINHESNEDSPLMVKPIRVLSLGGIIGGRIIRWIIMDLGYDNLFMFLKVGIIYMFVSGGIIGLIIKSKKFNILRFYLGSIWFLPGVSSKFSRSLGLLYGNLILKYWDARWNEIFGPVGMSKELVFLGDKIKRAGLISYKGVLLIRLRGVILLSIFIYLYSLYLKLSIEAATKINICRYFWERICFYNENVMC